MDDETKVKDKAAEKAAKKAAKQAKKKDPTNGVFEESKAPPAERDRSTTTKGGKTRTNHESKQKSGFTMPQVQPIDFVGGLKQAGQNQQDIMNTKESKQRFKDSQDPFKNNFFKSKQELYEKNQKSQNADRIIQQNGAAERRNVVDVAKEEQSNAQKLFAPAKDIQTDIEGNKLATRNGMPVGYSGNPKGAASAIDPKLGKPTAELGLTDAERSRNQQNIQNVAANFKPATDSQREMRRRADAYAELPSTPKISNNSPSTPMLKQNMPQAPTESPLPQALNVSFIPGGPDQGIPRQSSDEGFSLPQVKLDPLGLEQPPAPPPPVPYSNPNISPVVANVAPDYVLKALNGGVDPNMGVNNAVDRDLPVTPNYVDDFDNGAPVVQHPQFNGVDMGQQQGPVDPFWNQFLPTDPIFNQFAGRPTAIPLNRTEAPVHQGRSIQPPHPMSPTGQQNNSPEFKQRLIADQAEMLKGLPFNRRQNQFLPQVPQQQPLVSR